MECRPWKFGLRSKGRVVFVSVTSSSIGVMRATRDLEQSSVVHIPNPSTHGISGTRECCSRSLSVDGCFCIVHIVRISCLRLGVQREGEDKEVGK